MQSFSTVDASLLGEQAIITPGSPIGFNGISLLTPDHLLLVSQDTERCDGCLCHPRYFRQARVSAWSPQAGQLFSYDLPDLGDADIEGASLFYGSLVIARRHLSVACTTSIQPLVIEAYDVPGEELADQGCVMPAGNPGQSRRPLQ